MQIGQVAVDSRLRSHQQAVVTGELEQVFPGAAAAVDVQRMTRVPVFALPEGARADAVQEPRIEGVSLQIFRDPLRRQLEPRAGVNHESGRPAPPQLAVFLVHDRVGIKFAVHLVVA